MSKIAALVALLLVPACVAPAEPDGPSAATCEALYQRFATAAAALDSSCQTVADCAWVGGPVEDTCNCTPALVDEAVNRAAYQGSEAADLARQFYEQCGDSPDAPATCDAAPPDLACRNNVCVLDFRSCLDFDAGI